MLWHDVLVKQLPIAQERRLFYKRSKEGGVDGVFANRKKAG